MLIVLSVKKYFQYYFLVKNINGVSVPFLPFCFFYHLNILAEPWLRVYNVWRKKSHLLPFPPAVPWPLSLQWDEWDSGLWNEMKSLTNRNHAMLAHGWLPVEWRCPNCQISSPQSVSCVWIPCLGSATVILAGHTYCTLITVTGL